LDNELKHTSKLSTSRNLVKTQIPDVTRSSLEHYLGQHRMAALAQHSSSCGGGVKAKGSFKDTYVLRLSALVFSSGNNLLHYPPCDSAAPSHYHHLSAFWGVSQQ
ncbi:hypothetical protein XENOCAPTIV_029098, partial [Xenoophorus captivus]